MTVSTTDSVVEYVSGGPAFPIPYRFLQDSDIEAVLVKQDGNSETLTGAQYTLSGAGSQNGGTLTSSYAAGFLGVAGASLTISRVMDPVQPTDLRNQGKFLAETHEAVFDRLTMLIQQGFAGLARALVRPIGKNYYDAQGRQIKNLADPTENQDAATMGWAGRFIADLIAAIQGPINNAANIFYQAPDGSPHVVQDMAGAIGASLIGYGNYDAYQRLRFIRFAKDFNIRGDGTPGDMANFQAAADSGLVVLFPAGEYLLTLEQLANLEGGPSPCAIKARSGMTFVGYGKGKTVFKLKSGESSDASPKYFNLINGNTALDRMTFHGITFDINGQNNKISPSRGIGVYNNFNCAAVMISGSVATVGADAYVTNFKFTECSVINSPGVTCIALGQSNQVGTILGRGSVISFCEFINNGIDSADHSSIYAWSDDVDIHSNKFSHPVMSSGVQGPIAAAELHGSNNRFRNNTVENYLWGVYVAGNYTSVARGQIVESNNFFVAQKAVISFNESATEPGMADLNVITNSIWLTNDHHHPGGQAKKCIDITPSQGALDGFNVSDNIIFTDDNYGAVAVAVGVIASSKTVRNGSVSRNTIKGFGTPVQIGTTGGGVVDAIRVTDNNMCDIKQNATAPTFTIGIYVPPGTNGSLEFSRNKMQGSSVSHPYYGILIDVGTMSNLHMDDNVFDSGTTVQISDGVGVVGRRSGDQALLVNGTFPTQGTWRIGDLVKNIAVAEAGPVGAKYIITGWQRMTNGTSNTATDWLQVRALTGN